MENASQAILIAGGILLAILTISMLTLMFNNISIMQNAKADKKEAEELAAWNSGWEAYNKKYLYGAEVLTLINRAEQEFNENGYEVKIRVTNISDSPVTYDATNGFKYRRKK